jgi:hypothetical protein
MARLTGTAVLLLAVASHGFAQEELATDETLTLPPVIAETPGDVRLEAPPEDREDGLEVEVTAGQTDWRLPDLGTSLREEEDEREPDQRMEFEMLPYYDPEKQVETLEPVPVVDVLRDVGFLRIFEIDFGRRTPE